MDPDGQRCVRIDDPLDPRIDAYRDVREGDLRGREDHFIAEGRQVVRVLFDAPRAVPRSVELSAWSMSSNKVGPSG